MTKYQLLPSLLLLCSASTALAQAQLDLADEQKDKKLVGVARFETGSDKLTKESKDELKKAVAELARTTDGEILIVGHTDVTGTAEKNIPLSRARAELVKRELLKQGVRASRIRTYGAGFSRPLQPGDSPEANAQNRRAELWVGPEPPIAWVSWIRHIVESKRPADSDDWKQAILDEELEKRWRVRTRLDSAGEITFNRGNKLYLSSESLVVIEDRSAGADKKRVSDVQLEEGNLLARLANAEGRIGVNTPNGRIDLDQGRYRAISSSEKSASTVSAYKGKAKASGAGSTVNIAEGYGTRVKKGQKPEPVSKLPPSPGWNADPPSVSFAGEAVPLEYTVAPGTVETMVELTTVDDAEFTHPIKTLRFPASGERPVVNGLERGTYRVRLSGIDERGIVGDGGQSRAFAVVAAPVNFAGKPLASEGDALVLGRPGDIRFPPSPGVPLRVVDAPDKATAGRRAYRLTVDGVPGERIIHVVIRIAEPTPVATSTRVAYYDPPAPEAAAPPPPEPAKGHWYVHVMGGIEADRQAEIGPSILGEFGFRFIDPRLPTSDIGLRTGYVGASGVGLIDGVEVPVAMMGAPEPVIGTGSLTMIPIQLALTFGWKFGVVHPHLGGAVGVRIVSQDGIYGGDKLNPVQFSFTFSGGLGFDVGPLEITLDGGFAHTRLSGEGEIDGYVDGFTGQLGLKFFFGEPKNL